MDKRQREAKKMISQIAKKNGLALLRMEITNNTHRRWHFRCTVTGKTRFLITSMSPSDYRAQKQIKTDIRHMAQKLQDAGTLT